MTKIISFSLLLFVSLSSAADGLLDQQDKHVRCYSEMIRRYDSLEKRLAGKAVKPVSVSPDGQTLYIMGEVTEQMKTDFVNANKSNVKHIVINSPGGRTDTADVIGNWILDRKKSGSAVDIRVPDMGICASACTRIFNCAGNQGVANENALFLFHPAKIAPEGEKIFAERLGPDAGKLFFKLKNMSLQSEGLGGPCVDEMKSRSKYRLNDEVKGGFESCYDQADMKKFFPGYISQFEKSGVGMLDSQPGGGVIRGN